MKIRIICALMISLVTSNYVYGNAKVNWINLDDVVLDKDLNTQGQQLSKSTSSNGWNAGASSEVVIPVNNDGWAETTLKEINTNRMFGLSYVDQGSSWNTIDYTFYFKANGYIGIYEKGAYKGLFGRYNSGDVARIERYENKILYKINNSLLYSSNTNSNKSLVVDTSAYTPGATINNARYKNCAWGPYFNATATFNEYNSGNSYFYGDTFYNAVWMSGEGYGGVDARIKLDNGINYKVSGQVTPVSLRTYVNVGSQSVNVQADGSFEWKGTASSMNVNVSPQGYFETLVEFQHCTVPTLAVCDINNLSTPNSVCMNWWNSDIYYERRSANCLGYATNTMASIQDAKAELRNNDNISSAGISHWSQYTPERGYVLIAYIYTTSPLFPGEILDFHFYRKDFSYDYWTHKAGSTPVLNTVSETDSTLLTGEVLDSILTEVKNRGETSYGSQYNNFGGYFKVKL